MWGPEGPLRALGVSGWLQVLDVVAGDQTAAQRDVIADLLDRRAVQVADVDPLAAQAGAFKPRQVDVVAAHAHDRAHGRLGRFIDHDEVADAQVLGFDFLGLFHVGFSVFRLMVWRDSHRTARHAGLYVGLSDFINSIQPN